MKRIAAIITALLAVGAVIVIPALRSASANPASTTHAAQTEGCLCGPDCQCAAGLQAEIDDLRAQLAAMEAGLQTEPTPAVEAEEPVAEAERVHSLLYFGAAWCGPCQDAHPFLDEMRADGWEVTEIDIDADPETAASYDCQRIPMWVVLEDGRPEVRWWGASHADLIRNTATAKSRDMPETAMQATATQYVSYTTEPTYRTYAYFNARGREVCEACGRPIRRGRR